ncbi:MAG: dTDP-4-dehydrorhamnose reductase [Candidatus Jacksonbacteria bacterium]
MSRETKKTILLLGKNGILGSAIAKTATWLDKLTRSQFRSQFIAWDRADLDITDKKQVSQKINRLKPAIVINAAGYTDVDGAEIDRRTAFKVNRDAVGYIAEACRQIGARLIHFSTDYVFDGTQPSGYVEDDVKDLKPLNVYGESKRIGELRITNYELRYFIIRTSWLYGSGGRNFVDTMLKRAIDGQKEFKVVDDQFGLPTYTVDLAERVLWIVERIDQLESGVYHVVNSKLKHASSAVRRRGGTQNSTCLIGSPPKRRKPQLHVMPTWHGKTKSFMKPAGITWYEFAMEIFRLARKVGILSDLPKVEPCMTDEFPRQAKRPKYGALINTKLPEMREWKQALRAYLKTQNSKFKTTTKNFKTFLFF